MRLLSLVLLSVCSLADSAVLRAVYFDQNGDMRFEILVDKWWGNRVHETIEIPTGTRVYNKTGPSTLVPSNWTLPSDLSITLRNSTAQGTARTVFPVAPLGQIELVVTRMIDVLNCSVLGAECVACTNSSYRLEHARVPYRYGTFQQPLGTSRITLVATIESATGFQASISWDSVFPKNQVGASTMHNVTAWTAYITGAMGDTGRIVQDFLPEYITFFSDVAPGFILPTNDEDTFQATLDRIFEEWIESDCSLDIECGKGFFYPYPTLPSLISASTNQLYKQPVRICSSLRTYETTTGLHLQEIICSYDDIDLAVVIKIDDGPSFLRSLRFAPPSSLNEPPLHIPMNPPNRIPPSPAPAPSMHPPFQGPTLAFTARLTSHTLSTFNADLFKKHLKQAVPAKTDIRILSAWQLFSNTTSLASGIVVDTAVVFIDVLDSQLAHEYQLQLVAWAMYAFGKDFRPIEIDTPRIAAWGFNGCLLTNVDCGLHGTLYPTSPRGCSCVCDSGWVNAGQSQSPGYYCAVYTGQSVTPEPFPNSPDPWRNVSSAPPPPPKNYSGSWWQHMGVGGWLGVAGGVLLAGIIVITCCWHGKHIWAKCFSCCWYRRCSNQQASYARIQALRHQLHELRGHINNN